MPDDHTRLEDPSPSMSQECSMPRPANRSLS
jgi:hypothetical protein